MKKEKMTTKKNNNEVVIRVENICKSFLVPHEKHTSLKSTVINAFRKKGYEKFEALKDISFEVKKGEFFGIIGRNGSGKSTLLKLLAGIYVPDSGEITINGKLSPFLELGVGFNPELTGRENLYLGGAILGLTRKEVDEKYDQIVKFAELEEFIDMKFKNYSSGMQVRLAFSLSINVHAEILLMDEVLAVGDENFQKKCLEEFGKYKKEGKTIILVSHNLSTIESYCDRVAIIDNAQIKNIGKPKEMNYEYQILSANRDVIISAKSDNKNMDNRWGTKEVAITKTLTLNGKGEESQVFKPFDDIMVKIFYENNKKIKSAIVGVEIFTISDHKIFGFHSGMVNKTFKLKEKGFLELTLKKVALLPAKYYLTFGLANDEGNIQYDYREKLTSMTIISDGKEKKYAGEVNIKVDL